VEVDGLPALVPGEPVPAEALERGAFHVITAHNPAGLQCSPPENERAHGLLLESLASLDVPDYGWPDAVGRPIDSDHPPEQSIAVWWMGDLDAIRLARRFGQVAIFRVDEHGCQTIDTEIVAFDDQGVVVDLAYLAPTDERYREAKRAWRQLRAEDATLHAGAREALGRALRGEVPAWLLGLAADGSRDVRLRPPAMWSLPRDPDRIDRILGLLETAWRQQTDMRLGQLMANLLGMRGSLFGVEDRDVEAALRAWLAERG
jgi:hypothetical protein